MVVVVGGGRCWWSRRVLVGGRWSRGSRWSRVGVRRWWSCGGRGGGEGKREREKNTVVVSTGNCHCNHRPLVVIVVKCVRGGGWWCCWWWWSRVVVVEGRERRWESGRNRFIWLPSSVPTPSLPRCHPIGRRDDDDGDRVARGEPMGRVPRSGSPRPRTPGATEGAGSARRCDPRSPPRPRPGSRRHVRGKRKGPARYADEIRGDRRHVRRKLRAGSGHTQMRRKSSSAKTSRPGSGHMQMGGGGRSPASRPGEAVICK